MGRGRAKAKQTKVARDLKYRTFETDFDRLQRELHGDPDPPANQSNGDGVDGVSEVSEPPEDDADDPYADDPYADDPYADDAEPAPRR